MTSGTAIDGSLCSVYLVAVLGKDTNYCSRYPDFLQGVKCGNGLTSIEWCKLLEALISLGLGFLGLILKVLLSLEGYWVSIADPRWYGGTYLVVVQHLRV